jgi:hypothetical protein
MFHASVILFPKFFKTSIAKPGCLGWLSRKSNLLRESKIFFNCFGLNDKRCIAFFGRCRHYLEPAVAILQLDKKYLVLPFNTFMMIGIYHP